MRPRVVLSHWVHPEVIARLDADCEVVPNPTRRTLPPAEVRARAADAQALMAFMPDRVDEDFLRACPHLRVIACALKGYDNFDAGACARHGVWLTVVTDLLTVPTAELALALMLALTRRVLEGDTYVRSGAFAGWRPTLYGWGLAGRTVGVLGMGAVGRALARRLSGFDVSLLYCDGAAVPPDEERRLGATRVSREELLASSDFLVPLLPLTPDTLHLLGAAALARLKPGAMLVNVGRGSVVDEEAVADALEAGRLGGYAADVFEMEDWAREDRPRRVPQRLLEQRGRTVFTPHLGSAVGEARIAIEMEAARNILEVLRGGTPPGAVNRPRPRP